MGKPTSAKQTAQEGGSPHNSQAAEQLQEAVALLRSSAHQCVPYQPFAPSAKLGRRLLESSNFMLSQACAFCVPPECLNLPHHPLQNASVRRKLPNYAMCSKILGGKTQQEVELIGDFLVWVMAEIWPKSLTLSFLNSSLKIYRTSDFMSQ